MSRLSRKNWTFRSTTLIYAKKTSRDRQSFPIFSAASTETMSDGARANTDALARRFQPLLGHSFGHLMVSWQHSFPSSGRTFPAMLGARTSDGGKPVDNLSVHGGRRWGCRHVSESRPRSRPQPPRTMPVASTMLSTGFPRPGNVGCARLSCLVSWLCPEDSGRRRPAGAYSSKMTTVPTFLLS
jgi:hypothetical protein